MELAWEHSPTSLFLGAQPGNEGFFEKLGYEKSMASYVKRKPPPKPIHNMICRTIEPQALVGRKKNWRVTILQWTKSRYIGQVI